MENSSSGQLIHILTQNQGILQSWGIGGCPRIGSLLCTRLSRPFIKLFDNRSLEHIPNVWLLNQKERSRRFHFRIIDFPVFKMRKQMLSPSFFQPTEKHLSDNINIHSTLTYYHLCDRWATFSLDLQQLWLSHTSHIVCHLGLCTAWTTNHDSKVSLIMRRASPVAATNVRLLFGPSFNMVTNCHVLMVLS